MLPRTSGPVNCLASSLPPAAGVRSCLPIRCASWPLRVGLVGKGLRARLEGGMCRAPPAHPKRTTSSNITPGAVAGPLGTEGGAARRGAASEARRRRPGTLGGNRVRRRCIHVVFYDWGWTHVRELKSDRQRHSRRLLGSLNIR